MDKKEWTKVVIIGFICGIITAIIRKKKQRVVINKDYVKQTLKGMTRQNEVINFRVLSPEKDLEYYSKELMNHLCVITGVELADEELGAYILSAKTHNIENYIAFQTQEHCYKVDEFFLMPMASEADLDLVLRKNREAL